MERLAINELLKWKNKLGYKRTALCGKWSRILFDTKLIFLTKTQKPPQKTCIKEKYCLFLQADLKHKKMGIYKYLNFRMWGT